MPLEMLQLKLPFDKGVHFQTTTSQYRFVSDFIN